MNSWLAVTMLLGAPLAGAVLLVLAATVRASGRLRTAITFAALGLTLAGLIGGLAANPVLGAAGGFPIGLGPADPSGSIAGAGWSLAPVVLSVVFLVVGARARSRLLMGLASAQLAVAGAAAQAELIGGSVEPSPSTAGALVLDPLAATLLLVSVVVGALITVYATGYEPAHLAHRGLAAGRASTFLAWLLVFMSAMHLLVLADDLRLLAVGWEVTTLCSFVLIGFDGDEAAEEAARRALAYNLLGGVALGAALLLAGPGARLSDVVRGDLAAGTGVPLVLAGCVIAAATKSALVPFQSWLLGAMVAAAPVSALLHASAMVKAGSYLLLRLAPAFAGTLLGPAVAVLGAFTFATAALAALRQRDLKRILALSTISSLGMIAAAAGLGSPAALAAGTLLLVFHAGAKALAFLSVGAIEQMLGTRDLEVLVGSLRTVPRLAGPLVVAAVALALPPFGLVVAKWAIIELGARDSWLVALLALGGAGTLALWTAVVARLIVRRAGEQISASVTRPLPVTEQASIATLAAGTIAGLVLAAPIAGLLADPAGETAFGTNPGLAAGWSIALSGGAFAVPAVAALALAAAVVAIVVGRRVRNVAPAPYLSGAGMAPGSTSFHGVRGQPVTARSGGFYWGGREAAEAARPTRPLGDRLDRVMVAGGWLAIALVVLAAAIGAFGGVPNR